ncbi:asparagine synthase (glutamine-hydrolysing) [Algoriphagus aquaeductus]|uniref:asparagine synthase (glutamine-hydrolyzing) n=1 Tax=Algoriphagus aquaeductus TaxID=475299 RepID=A0A326RN39_9BACT|nr:asparagine synthase (glutamine-hydrolyzing) [Algoriphagus aquaeductus]PZV79136.1 asparagine synthase (glutamine-hydrolysing) [Algoriphagus aquaeductus]
MCGIAGIIHKKSQSITEDLLDSMGESISHRGPDASGKFLQDNLGLVHRRLSILDLTEAGNQPYFSPDGKYVLVFNGEIFNFQEFLPELSSKGYIFKSHSDTEVLLYLLIEYGMGVLERLNGFFAFALFNKSSKELLLARDRFGVKPLFYAQNEEVFVFGSEPKAIFGSGFAKQINSAALNELFFYRYVSGENTVFKSVMRLLPGHWMRISPEGKILENYRWFSLKSAALSFPKISNPLDWFEETFHKSIRYRMISDVPVGTLLSGGLDSSSVLYSQSAQGFRGLSSWNISFSNYQHDESDVAKRFSENLGVDFNSHEFRGENLMGLVKEAINYHDEPLMHLQDGHILGISKKAKEKVTVLLSGEGADEIMGGYVRYKVHDKAWRYQLLQGLRYIPEKYLKQDRMKKMKRYLAEGNQDFQMMSNSNETFLSDFKIYGGLGGELEVPYRREILDEAKSLYPNNRLRQLLYLEQHTHLFTLNDRNDRTTMGASIECRDPFLDPNLVIGVASLSDSWFDTRGKGKKLLFDSLGKHLPDYITKHPKIGLSVPWNEYFLRQDEFLTHFHTIQNSPILEYDTFQKLQVPKILKDFRQDGKTNYGLVRQLFFLTLWFKIQFENP